MGDLYINCTERCVVGQSEMPFVSALKSLGFVVYAHILRSVFLVQVYVIQAPRFLDINRVCFFTLETGM